MNKTLKVLGYIWSAPTTLLATLLFLFPLWVLRQARPTQWWDGAWEWDVQPNSWWAKHWSNSWAAVTLGWVILFSPGYEYNGTTPSHERVHVSQSLWLGPFYLPVWSVLTLIFGYRGNPLEKQAYAAQVKWYIHP